MSEMIVKELASLVRRMSYALKRSGGHDSLVYASVDFLKRNELGGEVLRELDHHSGHEDKYEEDVCAGIYTQRVDDNIALCEALRAVLALCGENKEVNEIIETVLEDHGL
jgi:hypothetical protein